MTENTDGWTDAGWSGTPERQALQAAEDIVAQVRTERERSAATLADLLIPKLTGRAVAKAARKMTDAERKQLPDLWVKACYPPPPHWRDQ